MIITECDNIDYNKMSMIDVSKIQEITFDWENNIEIFDITDNEVKLVKVSQVSVYNHRLILDKKYHILHALCK